jgi:hypothetical protein
VRRERPRGEKGDGGDRRACRGVEEEVVSSRDDHEQQEERIGDPCEAQGQVGRIASEACSDDASPATSPRVASYTPYKSTIVANSIGSEWRVDSQPRRFAAAVHGK